MTAASARVRPEWLALRGPADEAARDDGGVDLAHRLGAWLRARRRDDRPARLVDVGAGTGSGASWLHARLGMPQDWRLIDHDAALVTASPPVRAGWAEAVVVDLARLPDMLASWPADAVTCQALLDLLRPDDVRGMLASAVRVNAAVLTSLTVTGGVRLFSSSVSVGGHTSTGDEHTLAAGDDALVAQAFDAHQRRGGRLGPDAGAFCADMLRAHGYRVTVSHTPWHLGPAHARLLTEWLRGRAGAAAAQRPSDAERIVAWLHGRLRAVDAGRLRAVVDHVDVLGLPAPDHARVATSSSLRMRPEAIH